MTTEKTIALAIQTFVSKAVSLLFNMLSRFVIDFLPRSRSFDFMAATAVHSVSGAQEKKIWHCVHFFSLLFAVK